MAYERKTWLNKNPDGTIPNGAIPFSADNLNRMEAGIEEAVNRINIGEFRIDGDVTVELGYEPRYLTAISSSGNNSFSMFRGTTSGICKFSSKGFVVSGETNITNGNISEYFDVINSDYYFAYSSATNTFTSNNRGLKSTTAKTVLKSKKDIKIEFTYGYSSESGCDKFYLSVVDDNGNIIQSVESGASGATREKTYSGTIKTGQSIVFEYQKDGSADKNLDQCYFKDIKKVGVEKGLWSYMVIK